MRESLWFTLVTCLAYLVPICGRSASAEIEAVIYPKWSLFASAKSVQPDYNRDAHYLPFWQNLPFHKSSDGKRLGQGQRM